MKTAFYLAFLRLRRAPLRFCLVLLTIIVTVCIALWFAAGYDTLMANADRDAAVMTGSADLLLFPRRTAASSLDEGLLAALKRDSAVRSLAVFAPVDVNLAGRKGRETPPPMYGLPAALLRWSGRIPRMRRLRWLRDGGFPERRARLSRMRRPLTGTAGKRGQ